MKTTITKRPMKRANNPPRGVKSTVTKKRYAEKIRRQESKKKVNWAKNNEAKLRAEMCRRSFSYFLWYFWDTVAADELKWNWHLDVFCDELQDLATKVANGERKEYDLIMNVPPGTTKSKTCSVLFPPWCWTNWFWMRFIAASYSGPLALEQAELSREVMRSNKWKRLFPELNIKRDKEAKSNFQLVRQKPGTKQQESGGNRYSTSVGGTLTGFHGHILIVDDPLDPNRALYEKEIERANHWIDQTLSMRKVDKSTTPTITIMQRLHQSDSTGHMLQKKKENVRHICLPGEIVNYAEMVNPPEMAQYYQDGLLDPIRMDWGVLKDMEQDLGQYGYSGQVGQYPVPPGGGMFKVDMFSIVSRMPKKSHIQSSIRYWDKAGTSERQNTKSAYTVGVLMHKLVDGKFLISDVKRGKWSTDEREKIIRKTAEADGGDVVQGVEQEPASGGKESAENTVKRLAGFSAYVDKVSQDKMGRADKFSTQVNEGNVMLLIGEWNHEFIEEYRFFPYGTYRDQIDAGSGAFNYLTSKKEARSIR